jgi:hypothetical protein
MVFVTNHQTTEVLEPGEEPLDLPAFFIPAQGSAVLAGRLGAVVPVRRDQFDAPFLSQRSVEGIAVVSLVADELLRHLRQKTRFQRRFHEGDFMRAGTGDVHGDRKTGSVRKAHDFGAFAPFGLAHTIAPFLAGANVPSIKPSLRSRPPRYCKSSARAVRILAKTPEVVHSWKRRWQVLLGGYRSGRSAHGAPVRKIQRIPLRTARESCAGRPDFPGWALGRGIKSAIRCHCSFVISIIIHISAIIASKIEVLG